MKQYKKNLNIWIYGAGAVGCYYGARLLEAGHCLSFIARGEHLKALKENGLTLKSCDGDFILKSVQSFSEDELETLIPPDLVIVASKRSSNEHIANKLKTLLDEETPCFVLQNGLKSHEVFKRFLQASQVFRAIANIIVRVVAPAEVLHSSGGAIILEKGHSYGQTLTSSFNANKVSCKISENIQEDIWSKNIWNASFNSVTALTQLTTTPILSDADGLLLIKKIAQEVCSLAAANGIIFPENIIQDKINFTLNKLGNVSTSTLEDLKNGKEIEYQAIVGDLIEEAQRLRIEVPHLFTLFSLLKLLNSKLQY